MNINNITIISIIAFLIIQVFILNPRTNNPSLTNTFIKASQEYIKNIEIRGEKRVVIIGNGPIFNNEGKPLDFHHTAIIEPLKERFLKEDYTVITMSLPCLEPICHSQFFNLALAAVSLEPEAIVYHAISSGRNTDTLDEIFKKEDIPVYIYGRELPVDYKLYVGPDNKRLGTNLGEALLPEISSDSKVLYVETVRELNGDLLDNGYERINGVKQVLETKGAQEVDTLFTYWSKSRTYEQVKLILEQEGIVDYIITPSIETAQGAIEAIEEKGLKNKIKVVSLDFNPTAAKLIKNEDLYATISQEFHKQTNSMANAIVDQINNDILLKKGTRKKYASGLINKNNIEQYRDSEGNYFF